MIRHKAGSWVAKSVAWWLTSGAVASVAAPPRVKPLFNLRWRHEILNALSGDPALDASYDFANLRLRAGLELKGERYTVQAVGQGAGALSLPANGSFGVGRLYFAASGGEDTSPGLLRLAELNVSYSPSRSWSVRGGRFGLQDGLEVLTGDGRFDWVKRARLSERLVGTWDWVNVGRRFDGGIVSWDGTWWNLTGLGARVLQGGVDYDDAFRHLAGVDIANLTLTVKKGAWLPTTELRFFNLLYRDSRPSTRTGLGDRLLIDTLGASLVGIYPRGRGSIDLMLWGTYQTGDFGRQDHRATAAVAEVGYGWPHAWMARWVRLGYAAAGGDRDPADSRHGTFFNLVPTNHKFYGLQDLNAFQNLHNAYVQLRFEPSRQVRLEVEGHLFRLGRDTDSWYGGSGPANNAAFGYEARGEPARGRLPSAIGAELDLTATWTPVKRLSLDSGFSYFHRGRLAKVLFPVEKRFTWFYFMASFGL